MQHKNRLLLAFGDHCGIPTISCVVAPRECMPYVAQRVLSDDTPRMRALLRQLLYGNGTRLDMARLQKLSDGTLFTTNRDESQQACSPAGN